MSGNRKFFGLFDHVHEVWEEFDIRPSQCEEYQVLLATYDCENYEGNAYVLMRAYDQLYEVVAKERDHLLARRRSSQR